MYVKEKLVELLNEVQETGLNEIPAGFGCTREYISNEQVASHLIAHGVTVQEWISVKDELPKEQGYYRVYHKNSKSISDRFYYKDSPDLFVNVMDDPITYWKPIEQPPEVGAR